MSRLFVSESLTPEDFWRAIILYGKNTASYKFALAKSLLEIKPVAGTLLKLEDLAPVYGRHIANHLKTAPVQSTQRAGEFLKACEKFNHDGDMNTMVSKTVQYGFADVIKAFQKLNSNEIDKPFYIDERKANRGIRITDEFSKLLESIQAQNLTHEAESRWNLVETAWELGISVNLLEIERDPLNEELFVKFGSNRRKTVTAARGALNGYQRGKCFYCSSEISIDEPVTADVDHFFPHVLKQNQVLRNIDGVWNLVLSCRVCNRGESGKFAMVPSLRLLELLHIRNEYLIASHHPLRETLMLQTGKTEIARRTFLNDFYNRAKRALIHEWEPRT